MPNLRDDLKAILGNAYSIERELAGGGMSRVFLAEDRAFGRLVVVKVLPAELSGTVSVERFRREIATAARLQHAHIVPVLSAGEIPSPSGPLPYFTMPFVAGESLRTRLVHGALPIKEAVSILRDVAKALAYAHARGVVHRDIKPDNVLLSGGAAVVTDFGVAKALGDSTRDEGITGTGISLGTPGYMAPEQAAADPALDHRADIYAFGVLAYEMLTGAAPFAGRAPQQLLVAHALEEPPPVTALRPTVPAQIASLVSRCLEKRPAERPQSADELVRALEAESTPTDQFNGGVAPLDLASLREGKSRWTAGAVVIAAAAVAVVVFSAWGLIASHRHGPTARRVAVAPFENLTSDTSLAQVGRVAADWITQGIAQTDSVDVVSTTAVSAALADAKGKTEDVVNRLRAATHATAVITGSVARFGDSLRVSAQIIDAVSGKVIRALQPVAGPVSDPLVAIQSLRERLVGSLVSEDLSRRVRVGGEPPKYSAYREFVDGSGPFLVGQWAVARPFFERAIRLDSTFGLAYATLAIAYSNGGMRDAADSVEKRSETIRQTLSPESRLQLESVRMWLDGDDEGALRVSEQIVQRDSSFGWLYNIGLEGVRLLRPRVAIPALLAADSAIIASGGQGEISLLADAYHEAGNFRAEMETVERGRRLFPSNPYARVALAAIAGLRNPQRAVVLSDTLVAPASPMPAVALSDVLDGATEFGAHGDGATEQRIARKVVAWFASHPVKSSRPMEIAQGRAFYIGGSFDSAAAHFRLAAKDSLTRPIVGYLALVAAQQGDTARARQLADSLGATVPKWDLGLTNYWRAAITAQIGDRAHAVDLLSDASRHGRSMSQWHAVEELAALRGYPPFEALIKPKP